MGVGGRGGGEIILKCLCLLVETLGSLQAKSEPSRQADGQLLLLAEGGIEGEGCCFFRADSLLGRC